MPITHAATGGPIQQAQWNADHVGTGLDFYNIEDYGATAGAESTTAIQSAIDDAFAHPGGTVYIPPFEYLVSSALNLPSTTSGTIRILGGGRPRSFGGGNSGEPTARQGSTIRTTSTTASVFKFELTSGRQLITLENLAIEGKFDGTTGHGLHFSVPNSSGAMIVTLKSVYVHEAKQHGIFLDGNVFECQFFDTRSNHNGGAGLKAAANNGGLPGEVRTFGCGFNDNDIGIDVGGGGWFSFFGTTASYNTQEGLKATGVGLLVAGIHMEADGTLSGNQCTITDCWQPILMQVLTGAGSGATGIGISFVNSHMAIVRGLFTGSSAAESSYRDLSFVGSQNGSVEGYVPVDLVYRIAYGGSGSNSGGLAVHNGNLWLSSQNHSMLEVSSSSTGEDDYDLTKYDSFVSKRTASGITRTIRFPTIWQDNIRKGQRVTVHVYNASAGATTTSWNSFWGLAGSWTDPAAGKIRTITFEYNGYTFAEIARSAADITP